MLHNVDLLNPSVKDTMFSCGYILTRFGKSICRLFHLLLAVCQGSVLVVVVVVPPLILLMEDQGGQREEMGDTYIYM